MKRRDTMLALLALGILRVPICVLAQEQAKVLRIPYEIFIHNT
jgi:hypothetical protein